jgi:aminotransferase in exopolysaccharide biosynthesis
MAGDIKVSDFISFVRSIYNTNDFIPLHEPRFIGNEKEYVSNTIDSTFDSSVGAYVDQFEKQFAEITHTDKSVAIVNGTSALQVALRLVGVKQGDEVITQALTFVATANAIRYNGADPLFLDVDSDTMGLSPLAIKSFLENYCQIKNGDCYNKLTGKKISACVPMHTFGFPVRITEIIEICKSWNIPVVEDAAEALGTTFKNRPAGSFGACGIFSFNGNKIITSGGGGAIVTNSIDLGEAAKYLTTTAKKPHKFEYFHDQMGYNYRMPNLNAALLCAQLENLSTFVDIKRETAKRYEEFFKGSQIRFKKEPNESRSNYWLISVELDSKKERDSFLNETNNNGIMTRPAWQLMYKLPMYEDCYRDEQTNAEYLQDRIVNIPSSVIQNKASD